MKRIAIASISSLTLLLLGGCAMIAAPQAPRVWQGAGGDPLRAAYVAQNASTVELETPSGERLCVAKSALDTEDLRYLRNMSEVTRPFRAWTFNVVERGRGEDPVVLETWNMEGSFVELASFDSQRSQAWVVLVKPDGKKRGYPLRDFSEADQAYVRDVVAALPPKPTSEHFVGVTFEPAWEEYDPEKDAEKVNVHQTEHFVFYWGKEASDQGKPWMDEKFRQMNYEYFEELWDFFVEGWNLPLELDGNTYPKINIYVSETGLPKHPHGFAFGSHAILVSPSAMAEGSSVTPHEFGHSMQMRLGGFRESEMVGSFWETHANWQMHVFLPSAARDVAPFADQSFYGVRSTLPRYQNWPFLQFLYEHPRVDPFFNYEIWEKNIKDEMGQSVEPPIETMLRLGVEHGWFAGTGEIEFGDVIGEMAAHNVTWDYVYEYAYRQAETARAERDPLAAMRRRLSPVPVPDKPGWYAVPRGQAPLAYGYNIIDLEIDPGADSVTVDFQGVADAWEYSDWRASLVALDENGEPRYGPMWNNGRATMQLRPGETRAALAVAATPTKYRPRPWTWIAFSQLRRFPYEVAFENCRPLVRAFDPKEEVDGAPHSNGGGFVAATANVAPTAYVGPNAKVLGRAQVRDEARILDSAVVAGDAVVAGRAVVAERGVVQGNVTLEDDAHVRDEAMLTGDGTVAGDARVMERIGLWCNGTLAGQAVLMGAGGGHVAPDTTVAGTTIAGDIVSFNNRGRDLSYGLFHGEVLEERLNEAADYAGLFAHWDCNAPRAEILKDVFTNNDGVLRGGPAFTQLGPLNAALALNGEDQYAVLPGRAMDTTDLTLDMRVKHLGGDAGQRVLSFGAERGEIWFTPRDHAGKAAFVVRAGDKENRVQADAPLPENEWVRVTVVLQDDAATLYVDGRAAGKAEFPLDPADVVPTEGYLGRACAGGGFFHGLVDDAAIYRVAFDDPDEIPSRWWPLGRTGKWTTDPETGVVSGEAVDGRPALARLPRHWRNYVFSAQVRLLDGEGPVMLLARAGFSDYRWVLGESSALTIRGGQNLAQKGDVSIQPGAWHDLQIAVDANRIECRLDGVLVHEALNASNGVGGVGIGVADGRAQFRDLQVVGADGMTLLPVGPGSEQIVRNAAGH